MPADSTPSGTVKQRQAVSRQVLKVQMGTVALADGQGHDQAMQGLTVSDFVECGQASHGKARVTAKEGRHGRLQG